MTVSSVAAAGTFTLGGDLVVNRLGFGRDADYGQGDLGVNRRIGAKALRVLRRLPELGINFIDTADAYGPEVSENQSTEALYPYKGIVVATKGGIRGDGPGSSGRLSAARYLRQCVLDEPAAARFGTNRPLATP